MKKYSKQSGFTLIELMVTIAILAMLAMIAYPTYQQFIQRGRIENARSTMTTVIKHLESTYAQKGTFCSSNPCTNDISNFLDNSAGNKYNVQLQTIESSSFVLTAVPKSGVYSDDVLGSTQLYILYDSRTANYARCNKAGYEKAVKTEDPGNNCEVF